jgi:hypothetical protein
MSSILSFVRNATLTITPVKYDNKDYASIYIDEETKWHELKFVQSMRLYNDAKYKDYNGIMINLYGLYSKYICFDADCEVSNNFILKMIADNNLTNVSTPSYSHLKKNLTYKNHYYFRIPNNYIFNDNKKKQFTNHPIYGNLDIIYYVAEHKNNKIDYEHISAMPPELLDTFTETVAQPAGQQQDEQEVDKEEVIELLKILKENRGDNYNEWFQIGSAIKQHDDTLFEVFDKFSSKRKNYKNERDVKKYWKTFKGGNYGTLCNMAKEDDADKYKKWRSKWYKKEIKNESNDEYTKLKEKFKDRLFIIEKPLQYGYINEEGEIGWYNLKDLTQLLKPFRIGDKDFIDLWLEDITRKTYSKIDFIPNNNNPRLFNLFRGFTYDNEEFNNKLSCLYAIRPFLDLIFTLLNNEISSIKSFLDWWAWIRQKPFQKSEKAVVLYSDVQGVGKNTLIELFKRIITYSTSVNDAKDLIKNFNSHITSKLLICADEVKVKNTEMRDDLKNMITRTKMLVEKKCVDAYEINDYSNYIFTTNNQTAFYIEPTDRRFILLQTADKIMTTETSNKLYKLMADDKVLKAMDTFLKTRIIPDKLEAPMNNYKKLLIAQSLPAYTQMIYRQPHNFSENSYRINDLYECAIDYAKRHGLAWTFTADKMAKDFKIEFGKFSKKTRESNKYTFPLEHELINYLREKRPQLVMEELDTII